MKQILLLIFMMLLPMMAGAYDVEIDGIYYNLNAETKTAEVTYKDLSVAPYSGDLTIPASITYSDVIYSVTIIGYQAFNRCSGLTSIEIPSSVTSIGKNAFSYCNGLTDVYCFAENVPETADNAFSDVNVSAMTLHVPKASVNAYKTTAPWSEFGKIEKIIAGQCGENVNYVLTRDGTLTIFGTGDMYDFSFYSQPWDYYMSQIKSVVIEDGVTSIGGYAFYNYSGLTSVEIPNSVTSIGLWAFSGCYNLPSIDIPGSVTSIGRDAFFACSGLTSIDIPSSVTSIGRDAFHACSGLTSIVIPGSVTSIGLEAFSDCSGLTEIKVDEDNTAYDSRGGCNAIIETASNTLIAGCQNTVIPNSVTSIGNGAFEGCSGLTSVEIPNSVTTIGQSAYSYCRGLTSIDIPGSVTSIGDFAFFSCSSLASIDIPSSVTYIGGCFLTECTRLTDVYCLAKDIPETADDAFEDLDISVITLHVPEASIHLYRIMAPWSGFGRIYVISDEIAAGQCGENVNYVLTRDGTLTISGTGDMYDFKSSTQPWKDYLSQIKSVVVEDGVTSIGDFAFQYCSGLTSIAIPNSVTSIGNCTFSGCTSLSEIKCKALIPPTCGDDVFSGVSGCVVYVPNEKIDDYRQAEVWEQFTDIKEISYKLTYMIDDKVYKDTIYEYGATIIPEPMPAGDYATFEWTDLPDTMPAHDVIVHASYVTGITDIMMKEMIVRIYSPNGKVLNKPHKGLNLVLIRDGTIRKIVIK